MIRQLPSGIDTSGPKEPSATSQKTECVRAIGRARHDGPIEAWDIGCVVRNRPGETGPTVSPVDRKEKARPKFDLPLCTAIKDWSGELNAVVSEHAPLRKAVLNPFQQDLRDCYAAA